VFPDGASHTAMKKGVQEGVDNGTFQQLGVLSRTAETKKQ